MKTLFLIFSLLASALILRGQIVQTHYGMLQGQMNGDTYEFLGIPYASPPEDTLRWKPPIPPAGWSATRVVDSFPPKCPQKKYDIGDTAYTLEGKEDCLYLNIWSPDLSGDLPVMLFIHGGGNQQGSVSQLSGGTEIYHGKNLAQRGQVVVVTIQYRLGALGYLVHPGLEQENPSSLSGNYGVMDQIFALEWVQNNIAAFGGDPENVTIFGESGGGVNVGNLMTSPRANGLFHRAIIQSASPVLNHYDTAKSEGMGFVDSFIPQGSDSAKIAFMRKVHSDTLSMRNSSPLEGGIVQMAWQPVVDHYVFPDFPETVFRSGNFNQVPLIIGSNADEMLPLVPATVYPFMLTGFVNLFVPEDYRTSILELYPPGTTNEEAKESYAGILTDGQFTAPARRTAQCVSLNQTEPVFRYHFSHTHNPSIPFLGDFGAYHGIELFYVFNTWENSPLAFGPFFTDQDDSVQQTVLKYWVNFAYQGNPNDGSLPDWPPYDSETDPYLEIKASPDGTLKGLKSDKSDVWDEISGFTSCQSTVDIQVYEGYNTGPKWSPNPSTGIFYLDFPRASALDISVYNLGGQRVYHTENQEFIDLSAYPAGVYFVRIKAEGKHFHSRIIKAE